MKGTGRGTDKVADSGAGFWHYTQMFTTYDDVMLFLDKLGLFHMDLTLERVQRALERLNLVRPPFRVVQVVGTNGKGSTSTFLESLARCHGLRTGLFTSPHFVSPCERIRCNGLPLAREYWPQLATRVHAVEGQLTYFEFLTVLAVLAFAESGVDLVIMEAGLGGRWDATSAFHADILCVTPISMDHENVLGHSLAAIAADKAGAIRPKQRVFHAPQELPAMEALKSAACHREAQLQEVRAEELAEGIVLGLGGPHQRGNAALALACWQEMARGAHWGLDAEKECLALHNAFIPGRFQRVVSAALPLPPDLLLDGAHNVHGLQSLRTALCHMGLRPSLVIFSCLADKDMAHMLPLVLAAGQGAPMLIPTIAHNDRAASGEDIALALGSGARAVPALEEALLLASDPQQRQGAGPVLVCGSLYLLAEFFTLYPQYLLAPTSCEAS